MFGLAKWAGAKANAARLILPAICGLDFQWWIEPFSGNGSFMQERFRGFLDHTNVHVWLNDRNRDVVNTTLAIREQGEWLADDFLSRRSRCSSTFTTRLEFELAKHDVLFDENPSAYLLLTRLAVKQIVSRTRNDLCSMSVKHATPARSGVAAGLVAIDEDRLRSAIAVAQHVDRITNLDFRDVLTALPDDCIVYLDPTYWIPKPCDKYQHFLTADDHRDLHDLLVGLKPRQRFLMSIDCSEFSYHTYLAGGHFEHTKIPIMYSSKTHDRQRVEEYLIANFPLDECKRWIDPIRATLRAQRQEDSIEATKMLSTAEGKVGPKERVRVFNLPLSSTCCKEHEGTTIASPVCRALCYTYKMAEGRPGVAKRAETNMDLARQEDFAERMIAAIQVSSLGDFKIHVSGDFFSVEYIEAWNRIVRGCPHVNFWSYTRAWRRPDFVDSLTTLAAAPNMSLLLSFDRATGLPPQLANTRRAWMADNDGEEPTGEAIIAFRATRERQFKALRVLGSTTVCPHQNGIVGGPDDCVTCRICIFKEKSISKRPYSHTTVREETVTPSTNNDKKENCK